MTLIQKELQNAYIWEYKWTPGDNTIAYYPLTSTSTVNDMSGNSRNLTNNGTNFGTYQWVDCAYLTAATKYLLTPTLTWSDIKTISVWAYWDWTFSPSSSTYALLLTYWILSNSARFYIYNKTDGKLYYENDGTSYKITTPYVSSVWYNLVITIGTDTKMYINWNYIWSCTNWAPSNWTFIFGTWINNPISADKYSWWISNWVIENKTWSAQEISDYYNQTKSNYWL
jgi:hypothetical protein